MAITFANEAAYVAHLAKLVPDMKGAFTEADFIQEAVDALSEDVPAWATVDVGDGSTREWTLGVSPFASWVEGFSDLWPVCYELLDASGNPLATPAEYRPAPRIVQRVVSTVPRRVLSFEVAPSSTAKCRVLFQVRWSIAADSTNVPSRLQLAVVKKAAAKKCAALASFYMESIDPAGGSEIFDARQFAKDYADRAEGWDAEYAKLVGLGGGETGFASGRVRRDQPTAFRPWSS